MKKNFSKVMLVAAAAMAFFACQKPEFIEPATSEEVMLTFSSEKPAFDDETKTEWTGTDIQWSKGDKISVAYTVEGTWQNATGDASGDAKLYKSDELAAASATAMFNVSTYFKGETAGSHVFYGVYPAPSETGFAAAPMATLNVASVQNPKADSFDSNGDLMVGCSKKYSSRPSENETISLKWERLVAHAVISLKNINGLTAEERIENITLTAQEDANLVGQQKVDLITKEVVNDNAAANVIKLGATNLTVKDGILSFWACFLPETITSLKVEVETDKATYTRNIEECNLEFKQNARNTLVIKMDKADRDEKVVASDEVVDVLTRSVTGATSTSYVNWSGKKLISEAVYAGNSAGGNESIQLRSNNNNSGIVTTASGGFAKKVVVVWNSNTTNGRTLNIYGSHTAYSAPTDLYDNSKSGTKLGTIVCGTSTELDVDGDYEYIGLRSNSGAMYLEDIKITWSTGSSGDSGDTPETPDEPVKLSAPVVKCSDSDITVNSLKFTWDAVANASMYEVTFNNGTPTETTNTYYEATGLNANTNYSISVKAVGDGVNYTTSDAGTATGTTKEEQQSGGGDVSSTVLAYTFDVSSFGTTGYGVHKNIAKNNNMTWTMTCGQGGYLGINKAANATKLVLGDYLKVGTPIGYNASTLATAVISDTEMVSVGKVEFVGNSVTAVSGTAPTQISLVFSQDGNTYSLIETQAFNKTNGNTFEFAPKSSGYYAVVISGTAWFRLTGTQIKYYTN